jgi:hypothetical protein
MRRRYSATGPIPLLSTAGWQKNVEVAKQAFETSIVSTGELAELATSANTAVINVINTRLNESLDEVRDYAKKRATNH